MLGRRLQDPERVEGASQSSEGLGLLPFDTHFAREKVTRQVRARAGTASWLVEGLPGGSTVEGYEIHMGSPASATASAAFELVEDAAPDGAVAGAVVGTMLHGIFDNVALRRTALGNLWHRRGQAPPAAAQQAEDETERALDRLADHVAAHLDMAAVDRLLGLSS